MSKRRVPFPPVVDPRHDPEAIALRIHQIASVAGLIAECLVDDEAMGHVLYLIEECLLDVEARVDALRQG